jgi:DNA-directed RNA polymerase specialized sigma24 family protein
VSRPTLIPVQEWESVLQRIAGGEHQALAELYDATSAAVFGLALRIVQARDIAEDVVVEVYSQVWMQAAIYDFQRGTPMAWLLTLTRSHAIYLLRSRSRARSGVLMRQGDYCRADAGSLHTGVTTKTGCVFITVASSRDEWLA